MSTRAGVVLSFAVLTVACGAPQTPEVPAGDGPPSTAEPTGPITIVHNSSESVWSAPASLVEEASIGLADGDPAYLLGQPVGLAATSDRIYVLDSQPPKVRVYDFQGRHIRDFGRRGDGPGEFRIPRGVAVGPTGRVYVHDDMRRMVVFTPQGEPSEAWHIETATSVTGRPMTMADDGVLYVPDAERLAGTRRVGMRATRPGGELGTFLAAPEFEFEPQVLVTRTGASRMTRAVPFAARLTWAMAPSGAMIGGVSTEYSFEIHYPDGRVTVVDKDWEPEEVSTEEAEWYRNSITANGRRYNPEWQWNGPPIPATKPAYEGIRLGHGGRIWVRRVNGPSLRLDCDESAPRSVDVPPEPCWRQPYSFDVFDSDGRYLGEVTTPVGIRSRPWPFIRDDMVLTTVEDEVGTIMVKRYRLVLPGEEER